MENINKGNIKPQFDANGAFIKQVCAAQTAIPAGAVTGTSNVRNAMLAGWLKVFNALPVGGKGITRSAIGNLIDLPMVKGGWHATPNKVAGNAVSNALRAGKGTGLFTETHYGKGEGKEYHYRKLRAVLDTDYKVVLK